MTYVDDAGRLQDILDAIAQIEKHAVRDRAISDGDEMLQVWYSHYLRIIGEASHARSEDLRSANTDVPWR